MDLLAIKCLFAKLIIPLNHDELSLLMQYLEISIREYKYNPSLFRDLLKPFFDITDASLLRDVPASRTTLENDEQASLNQTQKEDVLDVQSGGSSAFSEPANKDFPDVVMMDEKDEARSELFGQVPSSHKSPSESSASISNVTNELAKKIKPCFVVLERMDSSVVEAYVSPMQNEHSDFGHTNTNEANSITENVEQLPRVLEYNNSGLAGNQNIRFDRVKRYQCKFCIKRYNHDSSMRRHLIVSHGIDGPKMEHFVKLTPDEALRTIHSYERSIIYSNITESYINEIGSFTGSNFCFRQQHKENSLRLSHTNRSISQEGQSANETNQLISLENKNFVPSLN